MPPNDNQIKKAIKLLDDLSPKSVHRPTEKAIFFRENKFKPVGKARPKNDDLSTIINLLTPYNGGYLILVNGLFITSFDPQLISQQIILDFDDMYFANEHLIREAQNEIRGL